MSVIWFVVLAFGFGETLALHRLRHLEGEAGMEVERTMQQKPQQQSRNDCSDNHCQDVQVGPFPCNS